MNGDQSFLNHIVDPIGLLQSPANKLRQVRGHLDQERFVGLSVSVLGSPHPVGKSLVEVGIGNVYAVLIGAQIFVPAERGLTAEWLHRELAQRLAARRSDAQCPLDVPGVRIAIQSGGPGFWVNISITTEKAAKQVLERARELVR